MAGQDGAFQINFFKYLAVMLASVVITILIVDLRQHGQNVKGCERRQDIFRTVVDGFRMAAKDLPRSSPLKKTLNDGASNIEARIIQDCATFYQPIVPFAE